VDHIGILKRAWNITWRYRILWLFGLLAGGAGSWGGGGGGNYPAGGGEISPSLQRDMERMVSWAQENLPLILSATAFLLFIGFALFMISIAAKGGLIHLVNEAAEERPVRGMEGWAAGFSAWLRVFAISFVLFAPIVAVSIVLLIAVLAPVIGPAIGGGTPRVEAMFGLCGGLAFGGLLLVIVSIVAGVLDTLGARHAVLAGTGVFRSIGEAWTDLRTRFKDVAVMWLLMLAVGIAYGVVVGMVATVFGFGIAMAALGQAWVIAGVISFVLFVVLLLPTAVFSAFSSAAWTIFYRRLSGREPLSGTVGAPGTPVQGYAPPSPYPPAPYPSAPPAPSAPEPPAPEPPAPEPPAPEPPRGLPLAPYPPPPPPQDDLTPPPPPPR